MTRVEELQHVLYDKLFGSDLAVMDALIAAARAEGAEREAAKIVHCGSCRFGKPCGDGGYWRACELFSGAILEQSAFCSLGEVPASVLAPKEEK